jgi:hypothetical protein
VAGLNWARALSVRREGRNCSLVISGIGDWSVGLGSVFGWEKLALRTSVGREKRRRRLAEEAEPPDCEAKKC